MTSYFQQADVTSLHAIRLVVKCYVRCSGVRSCGPQTDKLLYVVDLQSKKYHCSSNSRPRCLLWAIGLKNGVVHFGAKIMARFSHDGFTYRQALYKIGADLVMPAQHNGQQRENLLFINAHMCLFTFSI